MVDMMQSTATASPWRSLNASSASRVRLKEWPKSIGRTSDSSQRSGPMHSSMVSTENLMTVSDSTDGAKLDSMSSFPYCCMAVKRRPSCTSAAFMISPTPLRMSALLTVGRKLESIKVWIGEKKWPTPFLRWRLRPTLMPTDASTIPRRVVGMRTQGTPRRQRAQARPATSVKTPPPMANTGSQRRKGSITRSSSIMARQLSMVFWSSSAGRTTRSS
mmetsp:Transcript_69005/g.156083  ORF Transcript_69005/g.156083 Transcript_69005/m.156083 type:complete len:217 (+) Transcript_69005:376-1026(+)